MFQAFRWWSAERSQRTGKMRRKKGRGEEARDREALPAPHPLPHPLAILPAHIALRRPNNRRLKQATWFLENGPLTLGKIILFVFPFPSEKKAIMKLFRSIANQPSPEKATTVFIKPGKNGLLSKNISSKTMQLTDSGTMETRDKEWRKVRWQEEHNKAHKNGWIIGRAEMRTEFDIAPDWRAPKRSVVPMTQITRQLEVQKRLPRLSKHTCLPHNRREFVIHPEWIIH